MNVSSQKRVGGKRTARVIKRTVRTVGALGNFIQHALVNDLLRILRELRLFLGIGLTVWGVLSFASDRYCDGNASSYYACTRPSTYYYYPWWAVLLVVVGVFLIALWMLRRK